MLYKNYIFTVSTFSLMFLFSASLHAMQPFSHLSQPGNIPAYYDYEVEKYGNDVLCFGRKVDEFREDSFLSDERDKAQCILAARNFLVYLSSKNLDSTEKNDAALQKKFIIENGLTTSTREIKSGLILLQEEAAAKEEAARKERYREKPILPDSTYVYGALVVPSADIPSTTDQPPLSADTPYLPWLLSKKKQANTTISPLLERLLQDEQEHKPEIPPQANLTALPESEPEGNEDIFYFEK